MKFLKKYRSNGKKRSFLFFGVINFLITNIVLHLALFLFPILISTLLSQATNFLLGFYLYGKKVFKINRLNTRLFKNYLFLSLSIYFINSTFISLLASVKVNKNLAALYILPLLVIFSYYMQNKFVFCKKNEI